MGFLRGVVECLAVSACVTKVAQPGDNGTQVIGYSLKIGAQLNTDPKLPEGDCDGNFSSTLEPRPDLANKNGSVVNRISANEAIWDATKSLLDKNDICIELDKRRFELGDSDWKGFDAGQVVTLTGGFADDSLFAGCNSTSVLDSFFGYEPESDESSSGYVNSTSNTDPIWDSENYFWNPCYDPVFEGFGC